MKLGEIAHVSRGIATGNRNVFVMTRAEAKQRGLETFVHPIVDGARDLPKDNQSIVGDSNARLVVLLATPGDVARNQALKEYLGQINPKALSFKPSPIVVSYVGVPRFVANPDGLVVLNSLYCVRPKEKLSPSEVRKLVKRLNDAVARLPAMKFSSRRSPSEFNSIEI